MSANPWHPYRSPNPEFTGEYQNTGANSNQSTQTLYMSNLHDRKNPEKLKAALNEICAPFGEILQIIAMKSKKRKGQAWVVFKNSDNAKEALTALQGFPVYNKPVRVEFAKMKSDIVSKADGTFVPRVKSRLKEDPTKRKGDANNPSSSSSSAQTAATSINPLSAQQLQLQTQLKAMQDQMMQNMHNLAPAQREMMMQQLRMFQAQNPSLLGPMPGGSTVPVNPAASTGSNSSNLPNPAMLQQQQIITAQQNQLLGGAANGAPVKPNETLFLQNLPPEANEGQLKLLFSQYPGFREVRYISVRSCAFVEYTNEPSATKALNAMRNFEVRPGVKMEVGYARK